MKHTHDPFLLSKEIMGQKRSSFLGYQGILVEGWFFTIKYVRIVVDMDKHFLAP